MKKEVDSTAAIVCEHVADLGLPIKVAVRDEPEDEVDSGWQFLCGTVEEEDMHRARVWALDEVVELEPTLVDLIDSPPGTTLMRAGSQAGWNLVSDNENPS